MNIYFTGWIDDEGQGTVYSAQKNNRPTRGNYFEVEEIVFSEPISKKNTVGRGNVPPYLRIYKGVWHEFDYQYESYKQNIGDKYILMMGQLHGSVTTNFKSGRIRVENRFAIITSKDVIDNLIEGMAQAIS